MVALPPLNLSENSSAQAAGGNVSPVFDNSGFVVNYAPSIGVGGSMPSWVWIGALIAGGIWLARKKT